MNEHPLLGMLAELTGSFLFANNPSFDQLKKFQTTVATALLQNQDPLEIRRLFGFEAIQNASMQALDENDLLYLNSMLNELEQHPAPSLERVRIFRREVPFLSSQVEGSVPAWARGARLDATIGPLLDKQGRKVWLDLYKVIPGVKIFLQGASQPALVLSLQFSRLSLFLPNTNSYKIPACSVWINANLLSPGGLPDEYCGVTVKSGTIQFSAPVTLTDDHQLFIQPGNIIDLELQLIPKPVVPTTEQSAGSNARTAILNLPESMHLQFSHSGSQLTQVAAGSMTIFGQNIAVTHATGSPGEYSPILNRINIPFKTETPGFTFQGNSSPLLKLDGESKIASVYWSLPSAKIDFNNLIDAAGTGAYVLNMEGNIPATWNGLKDLTLMSTGYIQLSKPQLLLEAGRISITDLDARNLDATQRFRLWLSEGSLSQVNLEFQQKFIFFYNSLATGTESLMVQADCDMKIDQPVYVNRRPVSFRSADTLMILNYAKDDSSVMLYDDNLLKDISGQQLAAGIKLQLQALALNNAMFTVTPPTGFFLAADLKTDDAFDKAVLVISFGLLRYLPILPDPYVADTSIFQQRRQVPLDHIPQLRTINFTQILVATMVWENDSKPLVSFSFGSTQQSADSSTELIPNDIVKNLQLGQYTQEAKQNRELQRIQRSYASIQTAVPEGIESVNRYGANFSSGSQRMSTQFNLFTLLDVSTAAHLMGVNLGYSDERFIFQEAFEVQPVKEGENPIAIQGMDVVANSRFVRIYTLPQISWEPMINLTEPFNALKDPPLGLLKFDSDGPATFIGNTGRMPVPIAPLPLANYLVEQYANDMSFKAWSVFTLPNGMVSLGRYLQENRYLPLPNKDGAKIGLIEAVFPNETTAALQISTRSGIMPDDEVYAFEGRTAQLFPVTDITGTVSRPVLTETVTTIFNNVFNVMSKQGVPLERYDFSGYGANVFSSWINKNADIAMVSQAIFDVWRGRVAKEIIQVRSIIYPFAIRVVRTITMYRSSTAFEYRVDSGWRADSAGVYDFTSKKEPGVTYEVHDGLVKGVYNVKNIVENDLAPYTTTWNKNYGVFMNDDGEAEAIVGSKTLEVELVPVYFDADVKIEDAEQGMVNGYVPSKKMLGYLQVKPKGVIISPQDFEAILNIHKGLGGPVDAIVNIHASGQKMRLTKVSVEPSRNETNKIVFVAAAQGMPVLPGDGSWSVVKHDKNTKEVMPLTNAITSLVRRGLHTANVDDNNKNPKEIAYPAELFKPAEDRLLQYGFLQTTDTQKVLFRNPFFKSGMKQLLSTVPDLADAYRLLDSKGIFPMIKDLPKVEIDANGLAVFINEAGYKLADKANEAVGKALESKLPKGPFYFINYPEVKIYVEYETKKGIKKDDPVDNPGTLNFDLDSEARNWLNKMNDITMVIDLAGFERLFMIKGKLDTAKGTVPSFSKPELVPGEKLAPIVEILEVLAMLAIDNDYKELIKKGLKIAMSNSPNNWEYKFQADKEIPVVRFPPKYLDGPTTPLRLEANLKLGCYFNLALPAIPGGGLPTPSAGAFIEFGGRLEVMCVSLAAATIYAVGSVNLRISADSITKASLYMKFGFGVEIMVGLPVVGNVSVLYAVGIEVTINTKEIIVGAFLMFRGRAELIGGLVTITIMIEASGKVRRELGSDHTDCIAQVTFSIDISICFVIDIDFTESWQESRQIA